MSWQQLEITANTKLAEPISDLLHDAGALAVTFVDAEDQPIFEPTPGETPLWDTTCIQALFQADAAIEVITEQLEKTFGEAVLKHCRIKKIIEQDWHELTKRDFQPLLIKDRLWICPSWHEQPKDGKPIVTLDPGLAFGTGKHPTTKLCLEWLCENVEGGETIIDFGCGSGILAITALKLGAKNAYAVDIDEQALTATKDNVLQNQIDLDNLHICLPEKLPAIKADLLIANILANPLKDLTKQFSNLLKENGKAALSGILLEQITDVIATYQNNFKNLTQVTQGDWARIDLIRI